MRLYHSRVSVTIMLRFGRLASKRSRSNLTFAENGAGVDDERKQCGRLQVHKRDNVSADRRTRSAYLAINDVRLPLESLKQVGMKTLRAVISPRGTSRLVTIGKAIFLRDLGLFCGNQVASRNAWISSAYLSHCNS